MKLSDMPIRDFYALEVLKSVITVFNDTPDFQVAQAYKIADALLKAQNRALDERDQAWHEAVERAEKAERTLEILRPAWAQNWTNEHSASLALGEIWNLIGVKDQAAAMVRLRGVFS